MGCPLPANYGSGERRELPQSGPGRSFGRKHILAYFKGHRTLLIAPICRWDIPEIEDRKSRVNRRLTQMGAAKSNTVFGWGKGGKNNRCRVADNTV